METSKFNELPNDLLKSVLALPLWYDEEDVHFSAYGKLVLVCKTWMDCIHLNFEAGIKPIRQKATIIRSIMPREMISALGGLRACLKFPFARYGDILGNDRYDKKVLNVKRDVKQRYGFLNSELVPEPICLGVDAENKPFITFRLFETHGHHKSKRVETLFLQNGQWIASCGSLPYQLVLEHVADAITYNKIHALCRNEGFPMLQLMHTHKGLEKFYDGSRIELDTRTSAERLKPKDEMHVIAEMLFKQLLIKIQDKAASNDLKVLIKEIVDAWVLQDNESNPGKRERYFGSLLMLKVFDVLERYGQFHLL